MQVKLYKLPTLDMKLFNYHDAIEHYGSPYQLAKAIERQEIFKIDEGVYSSDRFVSPSAVACFKYPNAVITMLDAFFYYGMTDTIPEKTDIAIPSSSRAPISESITVHYSPKGFHEQGIIIADDGGYPIRIYSKERMLIELLRNKNSIPYDLYKEVVLQYRSRIYSLDMRWIQDTLDGFPKADLIMRRLDEEIL